MGIERCVSPARRVSCPDEAGCSRRARGPRGGRPGSVCVQCEMHCSTAGTSSVMVMQALPSLPPLPCPSSFSKDSIPTMILGGAQQGVSRHSLPSSEKCPLQLRRGLSSRAKGEEGVAHRPHPCIPCAPFILAVFWKPTGRVLASFRCFNAGAIRRPFLFPLAKGRARHGGKGREGWTSSGSMIHHMLRVGMAPHLPAVRR